MADRLQQQRRRLALEAARWLREHGGRDLALARRRAAQKLGIIDPGAQPRDSEIEQALAEELRLFSAPAPDRLRTLREAALEALQAFPAFSPRLVGAALEGPADDHSAIQLHLHSDEPEAIVRRLDELGIPATARSQKIWLDRQHALQAQRWDFLAGDEVVELLVLPESALRQAPLASADGAPMARASVAALRRLLEAG